MKVGPISSSYCGESRGSTRRAKRRLMAAAGYTDKPPMPERSTHRHAERPRERRAVRRTRTRGPDGDDLPDLPPPSALPQPTAEVAAPSGDTELQQSLQAAFRLDREKLEVHFDHVRIRLIWLSRWDGEAA